MMFSQQTADDICERLAEGEPLRAICRSEGMPAWRTVYLWKDTNEEFNAQFAHAREVGFDAIAEEALAIANTPMEGVETTTDDKGSSEKRGDMLGHRKLQIETRLKLLAKWSPKKYGDKLALGGDPDSPLTFRILQVTTTEEQAKVWQKS